MKNLTLVTGGVRSGKSMFAEQLAHQAKKSVFYLATMPQIIGDHEQAQRIERHRVRRPQSWTTIECPYTLPQSIAELPDESGFCIVDCLTVYVSNLLVSDKLAVDNCDPYAKEEAVFAELMEVLHSLESKPLTDFVVVTNEVGSGVVPDNALARAFRDFVGLANQKFAQYADSVWLTCAGLPLRLKPTPGS